ncbi:unnamed protein product [Orchesella dallaii]|uniref:EF-hand domain-containing protein n=1 Tax=Orchesella dallaii TaxID=48710 RepID=A0ABP1RPP2_9HEXA
MGKLSSPFGLIILCGIVSLFISENMVSGRCCRRTLQRHGRPSLCHDQSWPTPCCGVNTCNIFCCNCGDSGCRGKRWARDLNTQDLEEHEHDENKDGFYDKKEIQSLILSGPCGNSTENSGKWESEFHRMDKDKDGKLSYEEING